jgi:hypothetical protein
MYDVTSDHVNTTRTLCREAAEVTGKHCSRCIIKRNNVTVQHRDVMPSEDGDTVLRECSVITNTPVKYIMLLGVAMLLHKTWRYLRITRSFFENVSGERYLLTRTHSSTVYVSVDCVRMYSQEYPSLIN